MLFGKKKKEEKPIPLEDIRSMASRGMSDKEIIKSLKQRGYSYDEIEKAMLSAVKEGVDEPETKFETFTPQPQTEDLFAPPQPEMELPTFEETSEEDASAVLEDLIEGVIEEKWNTFEDRISKVEETFERMKSEIKQFEARVGQEKTASPSKDLELKLSDVSQQLEDLDARVGGLEKAFKQFLPSLTRNIESLSQLIHEMKEKGHVEIEEEV